MAFDCLQVNSIIAFHVEHTYNMEEDMSFQILNTFQNWTCAKPVVRYLCLTELSP